MIGLNCVIAQNLLVYNQMTTSKRIVFAFILLTISSVEASIFDKIRQFIKEDLAKTASKTANTANNWAKDALDTTRETSREITKTYVSPIIEEVSKASSKAFNETSSKIAEYKDKIILPAIDSVINSSRTLVNTSIN